MKYTARQYALSLYDLIEHEPSKARETIKRFVETLSANNQLSLARDIAYEFDKEWNARKGVVSVTLTASEKDTVGKKKLEEMLGSSIELTEKIEPGIGAGVRLRVGDYQVDNTLSRRMLELKKAIAR